MQTTLYGRAEKARKEIFGLGFHPKGFGHPHLYSDIDALTLGATRDLPIHRFGRIGAGATSRCTGCRPTWPRISAAHGPSTSFSDGVRTPGPRRTYIERWPIPG